MSTTELRFPVLHRRWSMASKIYNLNRPAEIPAMKSSEVVEIKSTDQFRAYFDASKVNNKMLVIQFTATWCGPCRFIDPAVKEFAAKYTNVEFIKIDVDKLMMVADRFQANTLPAFVLIKKGKEVDRIVGAKKLELHNKIEQHKM